MAQNGENSQQGAFDYGAAKKQAAQEYKDEHGRSMETELFSEFFTAGLYDTKHDKWEAERKRYIKARTRQMELEHRFGDKSFASYMGSEFTPEQWATSKEHGEYLRSLIPKGIDDPRFGLEGRMRSAYDVAAKKALSQQGQAVASGFMPTGEQGAALFAPTQAALLTDIQTKKGLVHQEMLNAGVAIGEAITSQVDNYLVMTEYDDKVKANVLSTLNGAITSLLAAGVLDKASVATSIDLAYERFWEHITKKGWSPQDAADQFVLDVQFA